MTAEHTGTSLGSAPCGDTDGAALPTAVQAKLLGWNLSTRQLLGQRWQPVSASLMSRAAGHTCTGLDSALQALSSPLLCQATALSRRCSNACKTSVHRTKAAANLVQDSHAPKCEAPPWGRCCCSVPPLWSGPAELDRGRPAPPAGQPPGWPRQPRASCLQRQQQRAWKLGLMAGPLCSSSKATQLATAAMCFMPATATGACLRAESEGHSAVCLQQRHT